MSEEDIDFLISIQDLEQPDFDNACLERENDKLQQENKQLKENKKELIEFLKEYDKYRDTFKWNEQDYIDTIEKIKELLGDKE